MKQLLSRNALFGISINSRSIALLVILSASFILSGCIPSTESKPLGPDDTVNIVSPTPTVSFYPQETGLTWNYLPDGYALDSIPVIRRIDGPRMAEGQLFIVDRTVGRGIDVTSFKQYTDEGVFKAREVGPGYLLRLNPPIRELPRASQMAVGFSWSGSSKTELTFTDTSSSNRQQVFQTDYVYSIVDKRPVQLGGRQFEVFVINLESTLTKDDGSVDTLSKEIWYTPKYGEVRNSFEQYLIGGTIFDQKR